MRATVCKTAVLGLFALGCGEDAGQGTVKVTAYGESFIEEGIPGEAVGDGWAIAFERFDVAIRDVQVAGVAVTVADTVDLSAASAEAGHEIGVAVVPAGSHGNSAFTIERVEVAGVATRAGESKTFDWVFEEATRYDRCETVTVVADSSEGTFQITVHADHFFYDSLVSEDPQVLFQAMADADADVDGEITQAELGATDIGPYDPGSEGGVDDLWAWLVAATRTLGHVDGEGHCEAAARD